MSSGAQLVSGLPDPTAALETISAAGGCPLTELLEMRLRAVRSLYLCAIAFSFLRVASLYKEHRLLVA